MQSSDLITVDPDVLGGTPVFKGTRVPVKTLFEYLENNYSLEEFLECFPSVTRDMARRALRRSESVLLSPVSKSCWASPAHCPCALFLSPSTTQPNFNNPARPASTTLP